jgi:hypothetical protein
MTAHHKTAQYFKASRQVRAVLGPRIAAGHFVPCVNCGRAVQPGQRWDVSHIVDAARGGSDDLSNLGAGHRHCNRSDGGRAGAAKTNQTSRRARRLPTW